MKITMEEASAFPIIPADAIVWVEVVNVELQEPNEFRNWPTLSFKFRITDAPAGIDPSLIDTFLWGQVSPRLTDHPDNKLRQWLGALLGFEPAVGFELDTEDLVGRQARAIVDVYDGKKGKKNKVVGLIPNSAPPGNAVASAVSGTTSVSAAWGADEEAPF